MARLVWVVSEVSFLFNAANTASLFADAIDGVARLIAHTEVVVIQVIKALRRLCFPLESSTPSASHAVDLRACANTVWTRFGFRVSGRADLTDRCLRFVPPSSKTRVRASLKPTPDTAQLDIVGLSVCGVRCREHTGSDARARATRHPSETS